jgi:hypothetical protein
MEGRSVIEVVEYDEAWPVRAAAARADLISLIQELTDRARADRGLPPVPVWEE